MKGFSTESEISVQNGVQRKRESLTIPLVHPKLGTMRRLWLRRREKETTVHVLVDSGHSDFE